MLTVMLQASQLKKLVVGQDHPTVIIVPRLGELHTVMAALRALGPQLRIQALMMLGLKQMFMVPLQQASVVITREHSVHISTHIIWLCIYFKSIMNYLHRVKVILLFVEASRNADIALHLEAGEALSKLFFAFDRIKYKRLWARYIADMHELKIKHPATWKELEDGHQE